MIGGRVLVTGASGFVGSHLAEALSAQGHSVRALVRPSSDTAPLRRLDVEIVKGDLKDADSVSRAVAGCDRVFHAAAVMNHDGSRREEYYAANVGGTLEVGRSALRTGVERLVYVSTGGVYGTIKPGAVVDERTPVAPDSHYHASKWQGERALMGLHTEHGLPVVVARLPIVLGRRSPGWLDLCRTLSAGRFRMIGDGANRWHPCHVADVVAALERCGDVAGIQGETYIVSADEPLEVRELVSMLAEEVGVDPPEKAISRLPFRALRAVDQFSYRALGREIARIRRYDLFFKERTYRNEKAKRELGFQPRGSIRAAVREMVGWYREQGLL
jgi:nucleoside-diphosphate-sugar epimerase